MGMAMGGMGGMGYGRDRDRDRDREDMSQYSVGSASVDQYVFTCLLVYRGGGGYVVCSEKIEHLSMPMCLSWL